MNLTMKQTKALLIAIVVVLVAMILAIVLHSTGLFTATHFGNIFKNLWESVSSWWDRITTAPVV